MSKLYKLSQQLDAFIAKKPSLVVLKQDYEVARSEAAAHPTPHNLLVYNKLRRAIEQRKQHEN